MVGVFHLPSTLGSREPSDPLLTVRIHPIPTPTKRTGLRRFPPRRVVAPRRCLAGLRRPASSHALRAQAGVGSSRLGNRDCFWVNWMRFVGSSLCRHSWFLNTSQSQLVSALRPWPIGRMLPPWRARAGDGSATLQKPLFHWSEQIEKRKTTPKFCIAISKPSTRQASHGNHSWILMKSHRCSYNDFTFAVVVRLKLQFQ